MVTFREFKVGDLFTLTGLKQVKSQKNIVEDDNGIPFVVQSTKNNMVKCHVNRQALLDGGENVYDGNTIVLGVTLPAVSYQEIEFGASQVITARRDELNPLRGLYIVTAMRKALLPKYSYTNKPGIQKYKDDIIQLPVKPGTDEINYTEDDIDWDYMESYIHELEESYIHELDAYLKETGLDDYTLTDDEQALLETESMFKEFKVGDLFDKLNLKRIKPTFDKRSDLSKVQTNEFDLPLVNAKAGNNGIMYYGRSDDWESDTMTIDIVNDGAISAGMVYAQPQATGTLYNAYQIKLKPDILSNVTVPHLLFLATTIQKSIQSKYSYSNKAVWAKVQDDIIQLPVKPGTDESSYTEDDIDWDYMESYIRVMEKQVITDVVDYKDSMITTAKELIYV